MSCRIAFYERNKPTGQLCAHYSSDIIDDGGNGLLGQFPSEGVMGADYEPRDSGSRLRRAVRYHRDRYHATFRTHFRYRIAASVNRVVAARTSSVEATFR